jgi:urease accessory protein
MTARLDIQAATRNGITYLQHSYFTPPLRVADITEDKQSAWLHLMLMNSSPGILDQDQYAITIRLGENASLHLHTQSYQRLFNMKSGAAQQTEIYLDKGASFIYLPHPAVPHENSIFTVKNKIFITGDCNLLWGEVLTCGRKLSTALPAANGEVFRFSKYHSLTEIWSGGKLIIRENLLMQPSVIDPNRIGQLEGFTHQASLICLGKTGITRTQTDELHGYLSGQTGILFGVSAIAGNGIIVRILGNKAEPLYHFLQMIAAQLLKQKTIYPSQPVHAV